MASREYSARLGTISDDQLQAALDRFRLGRLVAAEPLTNGLFGQNLLLETDQGGWVFRGAPHWNPAGEDDWQFPKERFFSRLVHESETAPPVPWPYLVEEERDIFGWGFALQPRASGASPTLPLNDHYPADERKRMSLVLGRALGGIHSVPLGSAGTYSRPIDAIEPLPVPYADYVESTIEGLMASAAAHSASTTEADIVWARGLMAAAREAMEVPFAPAVVHLDYGFHNVLLDGDRLTAVIDWMTAESGHPEADLARPLAIDFQYKVGGREQFLAGYRTVQPELPGFRERFPVFMLWERSLIWEYWQRHKGFKEGLLFRDWVEPFVRMLDD